MNKEQFLCRWRSLKESFKSLPKAKKIQIIISMVLSVSVMAALPVLAWFTNVRQASTVAKINSPAKLEIRAGKSDDIIQFKLAGIDVESGDKSENFVFCVEGEDISSYNLQIAHTTNINFTYTLYKAHTDENGDADYYDANNHLTKYKRAFEFTSEYGDYINKSTDAASGRKIGNGNYQGKSYDEQDSGHIQKFAEPLYWQTKQPIDVNAVDETDNGRSYNEYNSVHNVEKEKNFLNFYVLNVSWDSKDVTNDKETDMIYITAEVVSS